MINQTPLGPLPILAGKIILKRRIMSAAIRHIHEKTRVIILKIIEGHDDTIKSRPWCIALGSFDGVHLGHRKLVEVSTEPSKQ